MIVFDLTQETTFKNCIHWIREVQRHADEDAIVTLIGNKSDLETGYKVEDERIQ